MRTKSILLFLLLFVPTFRGTKAEVDLNNAQAIFIYNFLMQVQWPQGVVGDKYVIGIVGETPTYEYLKKYTANRLIANKPVQIVKYSDVDEIGQCQILFIPFNKSSLIPSIGQQIKGKSVLTVGEKPGTTKSGVVIEFAIVDGKLRYILNQNNAKAQQLYLSNALVNMSLKS
jgi:hypothetical protein